MFSGFTRIFPRAAFGLADLSARAFRSFDMDYPRQQNVLLVLWTYFRHPDSYAFLSKARAGIPYGVAIGAAAFSTFPNTELFTRALSHLS